MERFGIDISRWQGNFSIGKAIENNHIEYAILKIGGADSGLYADSMFEKYYADCKANNLDKGCYFFGHARNVSEALNEAKYWLSLMKGKKFEYPVFYDVEGSMLNLDKRTLTDVIKTVCREIQNNGYWVGIYSSLSTFNNRVYDEELKVYSHWVAYWGKSKPTLARGGEVQMWQFGGETNLIRSNKINGITVDQDYCYTDYPTNIRRKGLNGYSEKPTIVRENTVADFISYLIENGVYTAELDKYYAQYKELTKKGE